MRWREGAIVRWSALCAAVWFVGVTTAIAAPQQSPNRILVMPFENVTREGRIFWLTEASSVLLTDDLNALGVGAITREERREAFERLQVPPAAALTDATVIRIGQLVGAAQVVVGTLQMDDDTLTVHARGIALEAGRVQVDVTERGPIRDLYGTFERVARRFAPNSPKTSDDIEREHPPIGVFEDYIRGLLAETPATAINYLTAALKLFPAYDRARLAMWDVYTDQGEHDKALAAVTTVPPESAWSRRARFLAGLSEIALKKYDDAFATFKAVAAIDPASATALNNLGVVQLRRGTTAQTGLATYYFNKAAETDRDDPDYFFNLGYGYWEEHDGQASIYWLREAVRRNPADGDAHFVLGVALASSPATAPEATRERELARRLSSTYEQWEKRPAADPVPKGLERIKSDIELPHARGLEATLTTNEQRDQQELARFYLDRAHRLFDQENDRDAMAELNRALYLSPYLADAHLLVGRIHLRNGRAHDAIDAFKIALWSAESSEGHLRLAEAYVQAKDPDAARAEAQRALALDPGSTDARRLLDQLK